MTPKFEEKESKDYTKMKNPFYFMAYGLVTSTLIVGPFIIFPSLIIFFVSLMFFAAFFLVALDAIRGFPFAKNVIKIIGD